MKFCFNIISKIDRLQYVQLSDVSFLNLSHPGHIGKITKSIDSMRYEIRGSYWRMGSIWVYGYYFSDQTVTAKALKSAKISKNHYKYCRLFISYNFSTNVKIDMNWDQTSILTPNKVFIFLIILIFDFIRMKKSFMVCLFNHKNSSER